MTGERVQIRGRWVEIRTTYSRSRDMWTAAAEEFEAQARSRDRAIDTLRHGVSVEPERAATAPPTALPARKPKPAKPAPTPPRPAVHGPQGPPAKRPSARRRTA